MSKKSSSKKNSPEDIWVDVHNDSVMVQEGIRVPLLEPRDPKVWKKNSYDRKTLRKYRTSSCSGHFHNIPIKFIPVRCKLVVYLNKNKKYAKTTYSTECWQHEIPLVLSNFMITPVKSAVKKYSWNGRTYQPDELPFWGFAN